VDLAILKFRATDVPFLTLGKSTTAVEGQKVIVIGNPTGLTGTVSDGIISAFRENRSPIQIIAPISPGSSGSPVMDEDGQVIGVATLQIVEGQNLNFAIAVEKVSADLVQLPNPKPPVTSRLPAATPTPATDAKALTDRGVACFNNKLYDAAAADLNFADRRPAQSSTPPGRLPVAYEKSARSFLGSRPHKGGHAKAGDRQRFCPGQCRVLREVHDA
jgi:S1-C subfamily serine protease